MRVIFLMRKSPVLSLIGKLFFAILLVVSCQLLVANPAFAQTSTSSAKYLNTNPDVPTNLHTYTQNVFIELASTASCFLTGVDPVNPEAKCLGIDLKTHKIGYVENSGGAIAIAGNFIADTFIMPVNSNQYTSYLASNFGFTKQTYAKEESLGYNALLPTLTMWRAFRNITYMFFTLIFVVLGLGIMFRVKIDPKAAMTIQNQIPRIILALIFITFSYAIAGFLVDMMYVLIFLIFGVFRENGFAVDTTVTTTPFSAIGGFGGITGIAHGVSSSVSGIVKDIFSGTIGKIVGAMVGAFIGKLIGQGIGGIAGVQGIAGSAVGTLIGGVGGLILGNKIIGVLAQVITYVIVCVAILSALFRLWFALIKSYLYILLTVVFAPFYIAFGVIPGRSGITGWFRGMIANLIVFPATIVMFLLGKAFISGFTTNPNPGSQFNINTPGPFVPPLIGDFTNPERMGAIIGLAIILMTPEIVTMVNKALKVEEFGGASAIGKGLSIGARGVAAPLGAIGGKLMERNKQTGKAEGLLAEVLGRNAITRALFNTVTPAERRERHEPVRMPGFLRRPVAAARVALDPTARRARRTAAALGRGAVGTPGPAGTGPTLRAAAAATGTPPAGTNPLPPGTPPVPPATGNWTGSRINGVPQNIPRASAATMTEAELQNELDELAVIEAEGTVDQQLIDERRADLEARLRQRRGRP